MRRYRLWLCVPVVIMVALDHGLTLWGQSAEYWAGDYTQVNEASEALAGELRIHLLAFVMTSIALTLFWCTIILLVPKRAAMVIALTLAQANSFGAGTWVVRHFPDPGGVLFFLFLLPSILVMIAWTHQERELAATGGTP